MSNNTVTHKQIDDLVATAQIEVTTMGVKTTVVSCTLDNGFVIVESSSCVDPDNYDEKIGAEICIDRIKNKLWELEGYYLQKNTKVKQEMLRMAGLR